MYVIEKFSGHVPPFGRVEMDFTGEGETPPVILITGQGGDILLAAIRDQAKRVQENDTSLILIEGAGDNVHPKMQKQFIPYLLKTIGRQIIATTHSPFVISSVSNVRLFVCLDEGSVVEEPAQYYNKPVDEILISDLFEGTQPFNEEISQLIDQRKQAIETGNQQAREQIEVQLKVLNPDYFAYLDIKRLLGEL